MAIAAPFKETQQEGSLHDRNGDSFPLQRTKKKGLVKIEMAIASPFTEKKEGSLQDSNGDSFPLQRKKTKGLVKIEMAIASPFTEKKRRVSSR